MKKGKRAFWSKFLILAGFILVLMKLIDYFVPGRSLVPGLTVIGLVMILIGLILRRRR